MHKFTYQFLKEKTITSDLFSLATIITDLKSKTEIKRITNSNIFSALETIAIKESVEGSNAIEGIFTTEQRIKDIVEKDSKPLTHSEEEIAGYHDAIRFIKENYEQLSFNEETIKRIHAMLVARHIGYEKGGKYNQTFVAAIHTRKLDVHKNDVKEEIPEITTEEIPDNSEIPFSFDYN